MREETMSKEICKQQCHNKNLGCLCFMACCRLCGKHYLNDDGSIDRIALYNALNPPKDKKRKRRNKQ